MSTEKLRVFFERVALGPDESCSICDGKNLDVYQIFISPVNGRHRVDFGYLCYPCLQRVRDEFVRWMGDGKGVQ